MPTTNNTDQSQNNDAASSQDIVTDNNNNLNNTIQQQSELTLGITSNPDKINSPAATNYPSSIREQVTDNALGIPYNSDSLNDANLNAELVTDSILPPQDQSLNPTPAMYTNPVGGAYLSKINNANLGSGLIPIIKTIIYKVKNPSIVVIPHGLKQFFEFKARLLDIDHGIYYSLPFAFNDGGGTLGSFHNIYFIYDDVNITIHVENLGLVNTQIEIYFLNFSNP